jgi:hypothetical protein
MQNPTHEEVSARARAIWERAGCPDGQAIEHWQQAERELNENSQRNGELEEVRAGEAEVRAASGRRSSKVR